MTAPTLSPVLSKDYRMYIANSATPANDAAFTRIENENNIQIKFAADTQSYSTKSLGHVTFAGDVSCEIKMDFAEAAGDTGLPLAIAQLNSSYKYQIRHSTVTGGTDTVWIEGSFILADIDWKIDAKGVREGTMTFKNSDATTINVVPRALVP